MGDASGSSGDFLRRLGARPGAGLLVGAAVGGLRDAAASALASTSVTPNALTWAGFLLAAGAGACFAVGAGHHAPWTAGEASSWWPVAAAAVLTASAFVDMLDGALARAGRRQTAFGALLDSTLDRCGEIAIYLGCAISFASAGNVTLVFLSGLALGGGMLVSYVKARAENLVDRCSVGYWQRGERCLLLAASALLGHVPAGLWLLGIGPLFTAARRLRHSGALLARSANGARPWAIWRYPRGSVGYDLWTIVQVAFLAAAPRVYPLFSGDADPLGALLAR